MNYNTITNFDTANGEGIGVVLWVQGCDVHCKGCHNPQTWDENEGKPFTEDTLKYIIELLKAPYISRLTLSGGHPLMPCNRKGINYLIDKVKEECPNIKIWLYTGYYYKDLDKECLDIINKIDYLVDGPYIEGLRNISLPFRGSSNQSIIRVRDLSK